MENYIWLIAFIAFCIGEAMTAGISVIWFAAGALVAYLAQFMGANIYIQIGTFLVVSAICLFMFRPMVQKKLQKDFIPTNVDRVVGTKAIVCEKIDYLHNKGAVKINGVEWTARTEDGSVIEKDSLVEIVKIDGAKVLVKLVDSSNTTNNT